MIISEDINSFLDMVSNVMEAYTAALFIVQEEMDNNLALYACQSFSKNVLADCQLSPGDGFVSWVLREQKSVLVSHFDRSTTTLKFYEKDEEIKSLLIVPLPDREGVLYVDSKKSYRFTEEREKICRQMAVTALALIRADREGAVKRIAENLLSLSMEMDALLAGGRAREDVLKEGLELISRRLDLSFAFFVVPDQVVHYCQPGAKEGRFIHRNSPTSSFSRDGLLGWSIKNQKKIFRKNISAQGKSYVLNKEESLGPFANFVGLPLSLAGGERSVGGMGLIKPLAATWNPLEIEAAVHIGQRFFREWIRASG